jgi:hypothetical protein
MILEENLFVHGLRERNVIMMNMEMKNKEKLTFEEFEKLYNKIERWEFISKRDKNIYQGKIDDLVLKIIKGYSDCGACGIATISIPYYYMTLNHREALLYEEESREAFYRYRELNRKRRDKEEKETREQMERERDRKEKLSQKGIDYVKDLLNKLKEI